MSIKRWWLRSSKLQLAALQGHNVLHETAGSSLAPLLRNRQLYYYKAKSCMRLTVGGALRQLIQQRSKRA